jgi:hypothetical protein
MIVNSESVIERLVKLVGKVVAVETLTGVGAFKITLYVLELRVKENLPKLFYENKKAIVQKEFRHNRFLMMNLYQLDYLDALFRADVSFYRVQKAFREHLQVQRNTLDPADYECMLESLVDRSQEIAEFAGKNQMEKMQEFYEMIAKFLNQMKSVDSEILRAPRRRILT